MPQASRLRHPERVKRVEGSQEMFRRGLKSLLWHDEKTNFKILTKSIVRTFCEKEGRLKIFTFIACDKSKVKKSVLTRVTPACLYALKYHYKNQTA